MVHDVLDELVGRPDHAPVDPLPPRVAELVDVLHELAHLDEVLGAA